MNLLCWWKQRALANAAVCSDALDNNPHLRAHLRDCPTCRRFWNEMRCLSRELNGLAEPLPAADGFASAVWARVTIQPAPRRKSIGVLAPIAVVSLCAALSLLFKQRTPPQPAEPTASAVTVQRILPREIPQIAAVKKETPQKPKKPTAPQKKKQIGSERQRERLQHPRWLIKKDRPLLARRDRKQRIRAAQAKSNTIPKSAPKPAASVPSPPRWVQWTRWGTWYETQGDYRRAAAAYGSAYAEKSDPDLAFAAGQAAESAGDVTEALTYYTQILNCSSEKQQPQKGTDEWTHEPGTA